MDIMRATPFGTLIQWALKEYRTEGTVFGIKKIPSFKDKQVKYSIFGGSIESPLGPAAGPHTQLAQNLMAGYAAGARFFELKTVQVMDGEELSRCIPKPCIYAQDEGYNCEWSTELTVPGAFEEYVKGWLGCKVLALELGLGDVDGFIFNMSAGYDYAGITGEKVDTFLTQMTNAAETKIWQDCISWLKDHVNEFEHISLEDIEKLSPQVTNNITLSTMHGCPPEEIERIATHLIEVKGVNTYVKCNPTLLGFEKVRSLLDNLGFNYVTFDDHHFKADLQFVDAVPMLRRLQEKAKNKGLSFGVKLTNTFPCQVQGGELPGTDMYMSGRALYPLSLGVAQLLAHEFDDLPMSFSGGADATNVAGLLDAGIWPVTVATVLLKPGGYDKFASLEAKVPFTSDQVSGGVEASKVDALVAEAADSVTLRKKTPPTSRPPPDAQTRDAEGHVIPQEKLPPCAPGCATCNSVCPNRAYIVLKEEGDKFGTVYHIDAWCNECGNCSTFCPTKKTPYRDKFTLFWTEEDFYGSTNQGLWPQQDGTFIMRLLGQVYEGVTVDDSRLTAEAARLARAVAANPLLKGC